MPRPAARSAPRPGQRPIQRPPARRPSAQPRPAPRPAPKRPPRGLRGKGWLLALPVAALVVWLVLIKMGFGKSTGVTMVFQLIVIYNINFAIFNMIPLPPLDGSHILKYFLPSDLAYKFVQLERYSFLILIVLIWTPILHMIFVPAQRIIWDIFITVLSPFF